MNGLTFYIAFGRWGGLRVDVSRAALRLVVGFVAVALVFRDIELVLADYLERCKK